MTSSPAGDAFAALGFLMVGLCLWVGLMDVVRRRAGLRPERRPRLAAAIILLLMVIASVGASELLRIGWTQNARVMALLGLFAGYQGFQVFRCWSAARARGYRLDFLGAVALMPYRRFLETNLPPRDELAATFLYRAGDSAASIWRAAMVFEKQRREGPPQRPPLGEIPPTTPSLPLESPSENP
jgi:hypothetical protein